MDFSKVKIKSGWSMNRERFSDGALEVFEIAVNHRRLFVKLPDDALQGSRFKDNRGVLARIESACTELEFMACPELRVDNALVDAAQADWWYAHEKDYGDEPETEIIDDDE